MPGNTQMDMELYVQLSYVPLRKVLMQRPLLVPEDDRELAGAA